MYEFIITFSDRHEIAYIVMINCMIALMLLCFARNIIMSEAQSVQDQRRLRTVILRHKLRRIKQKLEQARRSKS